MTPAPDPEHGPAYAEIDLVAIRHNTAVLRGRAGGAGLMGVVKADAYGHGLVPCARAVLAGGADWLAVAQLSEAFALRDAGITAPLLSWLLVPGLDLERAVRARVDLGVVAPWGLAEAAAAARSTGSPARVQLKADTGLARNGAFVVPTGPGPSDWVQLVRRAAELEQDGLLEVTGVFSHFAYADAPEHPTVRQQQRRFAEAVTVAEAAGLSPQVRHLSNSAATLTTPDAAWDMVRPGLALYGLTPVPDLRSSADDELIPAMTLRARVAVTKRVAAGQGVSYGHTWTTDRETTLIDVPLGYADGVPRHASNVAEVLVQGRRCRIAGRVCMDQFVVDVGDLPVLAGEQVLLFGPGTHGEPTAQDWAEAAGTISYEIVARLGSRVPRVYTEGS